MKHYFPAKLAAVISALMLALLITGCDESETDGADYPEVVTLSKAEALSVAGFCVMRSDTADEAVTDAAVKLKNRINEAVDGASIGLSTD